MNDLEHAIAAYRAELCASADVASPDLDELEDHLRSTVDDLRARWATHGAAVTALALALGAPAQAIEVVRNGRTNVATS